MCDIGNTAGTRGRSVGVQRCERLANVDERCRTKAEARELAEEHLRPFNDGTYPESSASTLRSFVENDYLPFVQEQKRPSTLNGYRKIWRYLAPHSDMALRHFRTVECERLLQQIARGRNLSRTTMAHLKHFLSGVFRYAPRMGVLNRPNPVRDVCLPESRCGGDTHAYTLDEVSAMLRVLPEPAKTLAATAAYTGLRKSELRGLHVEDYVGNVLHVRRSVWRAHVGEPKGKQGRGSIPVIAPLKDYLDAHVARSHPTLYLFSNEACDGPAALDHLAQTVIPTLRVNNLQWYGWHAFRRGLATNLHELGIVDIVIQAILRHSTVDVTRQAYIKRNAVDAQSLAAMKVLERELCNNCATETESVQQRELVN